MRQRGTLDLFDYWNRLRQSRAAPELADLDPVAMREFLPDVFLIEVDPPRHYPLSQAGTRLDAIFAGGLKGRSFLSLWQEKQRPEIIRLLQTVLDESQPVVAGAYGAPQGETQSDFELLLLPLRHHGKTHARLLGRLAATGSRRWLGIKPLENLSFTSMRMLDAASVQGAPFGRLHGAPRSPAPSLPKFERRGHLRVYACSEKL